MEEYVGIAELANCPETLKRNWLIDIMPGKKSRRIGWNKKAD